MKRDCVSRLIPVNRPGCTGDGNPLCQLRGHFLGHWLSAAAMHYAATGDMEVKAKADAIIAVLGSASSPTEESGLDLSRKNTRPGSRRGMRFGRHIIRCTKP